MKKRTGARPLLLVYGPAVLSLFYLAAVRIWPAPDAGVLRMAAEASLRMEQAIGAVRDCRLAKGIPIDPASDPNRTGLIGLETSSVTTSLGNPAAKRTTTNPEIAGLLTSLLWEAGVRSGDAVAVGASSSFPALIAAALCACRSLGAEPLVIASLGASEWGANIPEFTWLEMEDCLRRASIVDSRPVALALGGDEDVARGMSPEGREILTRLIRGRGVPFLEEPDLAANVERRLRLYREAAGGRALRAFVNIGGSWANIGTNAGVLKLRPGLSQGVFLPADSERGVLQAMAARGIPVIHLLNIRGLAERYGLPWDPKPLPAAGRGFRGSRAMKLGEGPAVAITAVYLLSVVLFVPLSRKTTSRPHFGKDVEPSSSRQGSAGSGGEKKPRNGLRGFACPDRRPAGPEGQSGMGGAAGLNGVTRGRASGEERSGDP